MYTSTNVPMASVTRLSKLLLMAGAVEKVPSWVPVASASL